LVLLIIVYTLSSKKLETRAKQFLLGSEAENSRKWEGKRGGGGKGGGRGKGGEMTQTFHAHMNKRYKKIVIFTNIYFIF
jgi:hypothetical protein